MCVGGGGGGGGGGGEEVGGEVSVFKANEGALGASLMAQMVKRLPAMRKTGVRSLGRQDPLEKEMATHSSSLAWKIPWTEERGRLKSMGLRKSPLAFMWRGTREDSWGAEEQRPRSVRP